MKELNQIIEKTVLELPSKQKQVFLLRQHGEMSFKDIAQITGEPLNTVLSHMHYAIEKLRKALKES